MSEYWRRFVIGFEHMLCTFGIHKWKVYPPGGRVGDPAYVCDRCGQTKGKVLPGAW